MLQKKMTMLVYHMEAHSGFLIEPGRINLYSADQKFPVGRRLVKFDELRAKELMEKAGLSNDYPGASSHFRYSRKSSR